KSLATGTTFGEISGSTLKSLEFQIPPLPEQKAIASVLSSLDDKIDLLHRQNQTLEQMAQALYGNWISAFDFNSTLKDIIKIQNGYAFKSKDFKSNGVHRVIKIKNISSNIVDINSTDFVSDDIISKTDKRFKINSGDVLIAMTGAEIGKMGIVPQTNESLWLNQRVGLLKEKLLGSRFLAYLHLKSDYGLDYIENTATGSAQPNISGTGIENCEFPKLSKKQLELYSKQLNLIFNKIIFNLGQIRILEKLRDTLLPKLTSGEVRIRI
ncbi:restriction endonuclease subunit S, partial [Desulfothermus okinawensis]